MLIYALYGLFVLLQIGDMTSTVIALKNGGREANKIIASLMQKIGVIPALGAVKAALVALVYLAIVVLPAPWIYALVAIFDLLYIAVVANNIKVIKTLSK
ncbi:DUF5658 family protein [Pectobacterium odoriferum]|uniref:DUF5658 family protein n=1 Tax=Pectobacterium odoriferum TaxID=78398 RepID=UPI000505EC7A|nr:DUF5658 family protein [Pectobacterium odoriferum]KGA31110.1 hypothetical protein KS43_19375 [Pectobacterium odoriferum]